MTAWTQCLNAYPTRTACRIGIIEAATVDAIEVGRVAEESRRFQERIVVNPNIMVGKPVVKGTRIPVELVLKHLAQNPELGDLLAAYPQLTLDDVKACLAYAEALVEGEQVFPTVGGVADR